MEHSPKWYIAHVDAIIRDLRAVVARMPEHPKMSNNALLLHLEIVLMAAARAVAQCDAQPRRGVPQALHSIVAHITGMDVANSLNITPSPTTTFSLAIKPHMRDPLRVAYPSNFALLSRALGPKTLVMKPTAPIERELLTWTLLHDITSHDNELPTTGHAILLLQHLATVREEAGHPAPRPVAVMEALSHTTAQAAVDKAAVEGSKAAALKHGSIEQLRMLGRFALRLNAPPKSQVEVLGHDAIAWAQEVQSLPPTALLTAMTATRCLALMQSLQAFWQKSIVRAASRAEELQVQARAATRAGQAVEGVRPTPGTVVRAIPLLSLDVIHEWGTPQLLAWWGERVQHVASM